MISYPIVVNDSDESSFDFMGKETLRPQFDGKSTLRPHPPDTSLDTSQRQRLKLNLSKITRNFDFF